MREREDTANAIIEELGALHEYVGAGEFSLDFGRAFEKLRDYQLAEPLRFALLVVEAAGVVGAKEVQITIGRTTAIEFGGLALSARELLSAPRAVFTKRDELDDAAARQTRALSLLSIALHAAQGLGARELRLSSVGPERRRRAVVLEDGRVRFDEALGEGPARQVRFELHELSRATRRELEALVREACRYAGMTITLDGEAISHGLDAALERVDGQAPVRVDVVDDEGERLGAAGHTGRRDSAHVLLCAHGVLVERVPVAGPEGLVAIVDCDLRKDLSHSRVVRDESLEAIVRAVGRARRALGSPPPVDETKVAKPSRGFMYVLLSWLLGAGLVVFMLSVFGFGLIKEFRVEPTPSAKLSNLGCDARASTKGGEWTRIFFVNDTRARLQLYWLDYEGRRVNEGSLEPGTTRIVGTRIGHAYLVAEEGGRCVAVFRGRKGAAQALLE